MDELKAEGDFMVGDAIAEDGKADEILPEGFLSLWQVFTEAMAHHDQ